MTMNPELIAARFHQMQTALAQPGQACTLTAAAIATLVLAQEVHELRETLGDVVKEVDQGITVLSDGLRSIANGM